MSNRRRNQNELMQRHPFLITIDSESDDDEFQPPARRQVRRQATAGNNTRDSTQQLKPTTSKLGTATTGNVAPILGKNGGSEIIVPHVLPRETVLHKTKKGECYGCTLHMGKYACIPCGHMPFCANCLNKERERALAECAPVKCPFCKMATTKFQRAYNCHE